MSECIAIIPARSGSKSIKDKNLAILDGHPLLAYSIISAIMSKEIDRVIVSTDSIEYAEIAKKYGAEVPFLRPAELAQDKSTDYDFMAHAVDWFSSNISLQPEYLVHLRPTTPLRDPKVIDDAIKLIKNQKESTSLRSIHLSPESPFKWLRKDENNFLMSLDGRDSNLDKYNGPRQDFPDVYIPNGYVDIVKSQIIKERQVLHGDRVLAFETPFCTEVDAIEELEMIQFQVTNNSYSISKYLKQRN